MDKQEILKEIHKTKEHLASMEKMLKGCEYERWKPEEDEMYYFVMSTGKVKHAYWNVYATIDKERYNYHNCFRTKEQAKAEAEKILITCQLETIARRLNAGRKIDWANTTQRKYLIYFNHHCDRIDLDNFKIHQVQGVIYCLDKNFLDEAIKEIGEERLKAYLKG